MGGGDLNQKKSWHPHTMKNQERVWKAEQASAAEKRKMMELQQEIASERSREELQRIGQSSGVLKSNDDKKLEWMYKASDLNREDYLTGRAVDKNFEQQDAKERNRDKALIGVTQPINHVEHECIPFSIRAFRGAQETNEQVDMQRKIMEDPLMAIKQREMETRKKLLQNPVKLKEIHRMLQEDKSLKSSKKKSAKKSKKNKKKRSKSESSEDSDADLDTLLAKKYRKIQGDLGDNGDDDVKGSSNLQKMLRQKYDKLTSELDKMRKSEKSKSKQKKRDSSAVSGRSASSDRNASSKRQNTASQSKGNNPFRREGNQQRGGVDKSDGRRHRSPHNDDARRHQRRPISRDRPSRDSRQKSRSHDRDQGRREKRREDKSRSVDKNLRRRDKSNEKQRRRPSGDRSHVDRISRRDRSKSGDRKRTEDSRRQSSSSEINKQPKHVANRRYTPERVSRAKSPKRRGRSPAAKHSGNRTRSRSRSPPGNRRRAASRDRRQPSTDRRKGDVRRPTSSNKRISRSRSRPATPEKRHLKEALKTSVDRHHKGSASSPSSRPVQGPQRPPKRSKSVKSDRSSSSSSSSCSSSSSSSNDSDRKAPSKRNYGLVTASGEKIDLKPSKVNEKQHRSRTPQKTSSSQNPAPFVRSAREKLTDEEKERRLREMEQNANWRETEREINVKRSRDDARRESEQEKNTQFDRDYINKQMQKALSNHSSVEDRIKSKLNNIQRTGQSMNQSFIRK